MMEACGQGIVGGNSYVWTGWWCEGEGDSVWTVWCVGRECVNWEWCVDCVVGCKSSDGAWTVWWGVNCVMVWGLCGGL